MAHHHQPNRQKENITSERDGEVLSTSSLFDKLKLSTSAESNDDERRPEINPKESESSSRLEDYDDVTVEPVDCILSEPFSLDDFDVDFIETLRCIGDDDDDEDDKEDSIGSIESSDNRIDIAGRELRLLEPHEYDTIFNDVVDRQQQQQQSNPSDDIIAELRNNLIELSLGDSTGFIDNNDDYEPRRLPLSPNFNVTELLHLPLLAESPPPPVVDEDDDRRPSASTPTDDTASELRNNLIELSLKHLEFIDDDVDETLDITTTLETPTTATMSSHATPPRQPQAAASSQQQRRGPNLLAHHYQQSFTPQKERSCLGHKETIFGTTFSPSGAYLATASQDSDVKIWNVAENKLVGTLRGHDREYECLRVAWAPQDWGMRQFHRRSDDETADSIVASAGANGTVHLWRSTPSRPFSSSSQKPIVTVDHAAIDGDDEAVPQVYALQFVRRWVGLGEDLILTSSDDCIHLWELVAGGGGGEEEATPEVKKAMTFHFTSLDKGYSGVFVRMPAGDDDEAGGTIGSKEMNSKDIDETTTATTTATTAGFAFGGERNPDNIVFVFDACFSSSNNLLGVALSDGTVRLVNNRGACVSLLQLPGCNAHLTSLAFDKKGRRLASVVATGHVILWELEVGDGRGKVMPRCTAVLQGGHEPGRPLFGAKYCGGDEEEFLISWGVDGRLVLWDSYSYGEVFNPLCLLSSKSEYPIFAVDIARCSDVTRIAVGGGREGGFLGVPVYLYDVENIDK